METGVAGLERFVTGRLGGSDFSEHAFEGGSETRARTGAGRWQRAEAAGGESGTGDEWPGRAGNFVDVPFARDRERNLAEAIRPGKRHQDEAEHVVADAGHEWQTRVGGLRKRNGCVFRFRRIRKMEIRYSEKLRENRHSVWICFLA